MGERPGRIDNSDNDCIFADESDTASAITPDDNNWKIIIADDEEEVHNITCMVLDDFSFEGRGLEFLHAYSGEQTEQLLLQHPDTSIVLLDVVMETDDSGLQVARRIRQDLKNKFVRIILRTGQPGKAPENNVIKEYDINDYKEKTELTAQKLFTTITSSLRDYRDLRIIEKNRRGLEQIIDSSARLFEVQSLKTFAKGVLTQLIAILRLDESSFYLQESAFTASQEKDDFIIIAATGQYETLVDKPVKEVLPKKIVRYVLQAATEEKSFFLEDTYLGYFATKSGSKHLLYLKGCRNLTDLDRDLIRIFSTNVAIAFENIDLNQEIVDTQKEVIMTLGEVVENRSKETGNHVRRVAEISYLLALKAGLGEKKAELLRLASPMHDVGKVGIPDAILFKPSSLSREEFETIRYHTNIGYEILKNSNREIMEAAVIAAQQHHERWDGKGYPKGLKGEDIHIYGRITALSDVFDALTHRRIYKEPWAIHRVLDYVREQKGKHFDPRLVTIFLDNINEIMAINEKYPDKTENQSTTTVSN
jgi:response regulator RpfG family c-di-GMP phosphodiesterase